MIRAEVHSDDHIRRVTFDATEWFAQASDKEIVDLAGCGWGGDYPADEIATFMASRNASVADVFDYLELANNPYREAVGFECNVDPSQAVAWIADNRPHLGFNRDDAFFLP